MQLNTYILHERFAIGKLAETYGKPQYSAYLKKVLGGKINLEYNKSRQQPSSRGAKRRGDPLRSAHIKNQIKFKIRVLICYNHICKNKHEIL